MPVSSFTNSCKKASKKLPTGSENCPGVQLNLTREQLFAIDQGLQRRISECSRNAEAESRSGDTYWRDQLAIAIEVHDLVDQL